MRRCRAGAIHADLFRDNVMFDGDLLTGVFDFYFAGVDSLLFDIAVALNDWCIDLAAGRLAEDRAEALVDAYESVRPLESAECRLLPALMRAGAFRFWLSRLWDVHLPRDAVLLTAHDPTHFERVLRAARAAPWHPARPGRRRHEAALVAPAPGRRLGAARPSSVFVRQPFGFAALFAACLFAYAGLAWCRSSARAPAAVLLPAGSLVFMIATRAPLAGQRRCRARSSSSPPPAGSG